MVRTQAAKLKMYLALYENLSRSNGATPAIRDHTVLSAA